MEYLLCIGLVIGVPVWLVFRSIGAAKQQQALEEYAWSLQNWEFDEEGYELRINFPSMRAFERKYSHDWPGFDDRNEFEVRRRKKDGAWQLRYTPDSHQAELARTRALVAESAAGIFMKEKLEKLEAGNKWESVGESLQAPIETAYQRYIHRA